MANEIDLLMDKDPLELTKEDIESIVTYYRRLRVQFEAGVKPEKETSKVKLDLTSLGLKSKTDFKRRV